MSTQQALESSSLGILGQEVPLARVDKALKELWGKDEARTKASLMNFAIYNEAPAALEANTKLLADITREHACRGILILALPGESPPQARAWVTAHCQMYDGRKSVCSEQISFLIQGGSANTLRNIIFAHLDSDLPLVFWWQGDLTANFDERLYSVIDLLFIDSSKWSQPECDFARLNEARMQKEGSSQFRVYDLSWLRSHYFRTALASCFQTQLALAELPLLQSLKIVHGAGHRVAGLLLAAWVAVRLKGDVDTADGSISIQLPEGRKVEVTLSEGVEEDALQSLELASAAATFRVTRAAGSAFVSTQVELSGHTFQELLPADHPDDTALIANLLSRFGGRSLYLQMVPTLQKMLAVH